MVGDTMQNQVETELLAWIDSVPFSRPAKNLTKDFSDAVLVAEILRFYYPRYVELHNYVPASSLNIKIENWNTLNRKVLAKIDVKLNKETICHLANGSQGAIEKLLLELRTKILKDDEKLHKQKLVKHSIESTDVQPSKEEIVDNLSHDEQLNSPEESLDKPESDNEISQSNRTSKVGCFKRVISVVFGWIAFLSLWNIFRLLRFNKYSPNMILDGISCTKLLCLAAATVVGGAALLLVSLYLYIVFTRGVCKSKNRMDGKTVIVTGCTSGIGKETAKDLAKRGARIIVACRNMDSANKLKDEIAKETSNSNIVIRKLDLSSLQSIREFAQQINREEARLDVLIHNAGTAETFRKKLTVDGLEMTMGTNHFGPFLLTHLLIDLLKRSKPSRIVVVASELYRLSRLNLNNINPTTSFPAYLYYVSKYANIVFTLELARRLEGTGVTANCLHPGMIDSGIWRNVPIPLSWFLNLIIKTFFKTPKQGAQTTIHLAVSEELNGVSGKYFMDCAEHRLTRAVKDPAKGKKLWELSEPLVKLQPTDPKI